MVKIKNPLGDVKIGRQGEVVYQRKYGEQIRRQVSPKRAIPSQRQIDHRQLYRDALAWRKQLSLANRRYLEGYCIANGVVDSYHIPLPWSRFALKCYLEHVHFVVITKPIPGEEAEEALFEHYDNEADLTAYYSCYANWWLYQTFTPLITHDLTKVELYVYRDGLPGTVTVSIRNTGANGRPTGADLVTNTFNGNDLLGSPTWQAILLDLSNLILGTKYAIVMRALAGNTYKMVRWCADITSPTYTRGWAGPSSSSGDTWGDYPLVDFGFREYGKGASEAGVKGLLHVRHPALMKVVHKRGELTVREYDTLSSLDKEYLTGQVGLDVEAGDLIEATTLPGIDYAFKVA